MLKANRVSLRSTKTSKCAMLLPKPERVVVQRRSERSVPMRVLLGATGLFYVLVIGLVSGCGYTGPMKKDNFDVELEVSLKNSSGMPLANYQFLPNFGYKPKLSKFTDDHGEYRQTLTRNNTPTTTMIWYSFTGPRDLDSFSMPFWFYLPDVHLYGLYSVVIREPLATENSEENSSANSNKVVYVPPPFIPASETSPGYSENKERAIYDLVVSGKNDGGKAYKHSIVIANNEEVHLLPMMPYTIKIADAGIESISVPPDPRLRISAKLSPLEERRGWHLDIDLVLMDQ